MIIDTEILEYVAEKDYMKAIKEIKNNEIKLMYEDEKTIVELCRKGKKIYTIIESFGTKNLDEALNKMISLAV